MLRSLLRDERATVTVVIAAMMLIIMAMAGFAFDFGRFYLSQSRDQLAADMAASAAALAFSSSQSQTTAATQACVTAAMNGVNVTCSSPSQTTVTTTFGTDPQGTGDTGIHVVVSTKLSYSPFSALFSAIGQNQTLPVKAGAWARVSPGAPPCIVALNAGSASYPDAIHLTGGNGQPTIAAPNCSVQSVGPIYLQGTTQIEAKSVASASTATTDQGSATYTQPDPNNPGSTIPLTPKQHAAAPSDPYAGSSTVISDHSHLSAVSSNTAPSAPSITAPTAAASSNTPLPITSCPGGTVNVTSGSYKNVTLDANNCIFNMPASFSASALVIGDGYNNNTNVTVNFASSGTYNIGSVVSDAAGTLIKASGSTFNIPNGVSTGETGATLTFGCGSVAASGAQCSSPSENTYNIAGGVNAISSGSWIVFGNSDSPNTFTISGGVNSTQSPSSVVFGASNNFTIAGGVQNTGSGSVVFGNGGTFSISGGITATSGSTVTLGNGTAFTILGASNAPAISGAGAAITFGTGDFTIAAASGQSAISVGGGDCNTSSNFIKFGNSPNSFVADGPITLTGACFTFGNAPNHDINAGGAANLAIDNLNKGTTTLSFGTGTYTMNGGLALAGSSTSTGSNMSLVMSGSLNLTAGANNISWSAPSSAAYLVYTTSSSGGDGSTSSTNAIDLSGAATTVLSGVLYAPNGGMHLSGSGEINSAAPSGSCSAIAAQYITITGGAAAASTCPGTGGSSTGQIALVQ